MITDYIHRGEGGWGGGYVQMITDYMGGETPKSDYIVYE